MSNIKAKILQFGGKQKQEELLTTIQVRKGDVAKTYEFLKVRNIYDNERFLYVCN